jgi:hypothetical protein
MTIERDLLRAHAFGARPAARTCMFASFTQMPAKRLRAWRISQAVDRVARD